MKNIIIFHLKIVILTAIKIAVHVYRTGVLTLLRFVYLMIIYLLKNDKGMCNFKQ